MRTKVNIKIVAMLWLVFVMSAVFVSELTLTVSAQDTADLPSRSVYTGTDNNSCKWSYDTTTRVLTVESNDSDAKTLHSLTGSNIDVVKANASRLVLKKIDTVMPSVFKGYHFSTIEFCPELRWIRDNAFENNKSLTGIDLSGTTLFWIEPSAFKGCVNLKSAVFPDTLRQINESAFEGCTALREVDLSNTGVYIIDDSAFKECTFLGKMLFPDTLETLGDYAIYKCGSISDSNTEIASRLKELDLRMVKKFGDHAVSENRWLTTISISKKIDEIGGSVTSTTFVGNGRSVSAANGYWDTYFYGTEDLFNSIPNLKDNPFPKAVTYTEYPLWGGGTQVRFENCNDIPAAAPGNRTGKASYDPFKNILTLDGYKYTGPGYYKSATSRITAGIYSELADELTIELIGENEVIVEETTDAGNHDGIYSENDLVIKGSGSLDVEPGTGSGNSVCYGICFYKGLTIGGDCTVNARAPSGSKVKESIAILGGLNNHLTIKDRCTVNAAGGDTSGADNTFSCGISIKNDIEITGGKVVTTGGMAKYSHGIRSVSGATKIAPADNSAIEVEASGKTQAIYGNVINKISGVGWTNAGGTEGAETITKSDSARELNYKKVRFLAYMIKATADPKEEETKVSGIPLATMTAKGKNSLVIKWAEVKGADGYDIFFSECNHNDKKSPKKNIKTINSGKTLSWTKKGLKKGSSFKACVKAFVMKNGKKVYVGTSPAVHAFTGGYAKVYTNAKAVKVNKTKVTLSKGKTIKIKAKVIKLKKDKKLMPKSHAPKLRYLTTDRKVATVSKSGKIKARGKGKCKVYVIAHDGVRKAVKVTVR